VVVRFLFLLALGLGDGGPCDLGKLSIQQRDYAAAQGHLWRCVEKGSADRDHAYQLALTYRERKNYEEGIRQTGTLLARKPDWPDMLYLFGFLQFRMGQHQASLETLTKAYKLDQEDWRVHHAFGLNYVVLDVKPGAEVSLENAVRLNPANPELHYHLARFYYSDNRPEQSIAAARRALELSPEYAEAFNNLGLCYEALRDEAAARENFARAIEVNRKHGRRDEWPFLNLASLLLNQGHAQESLPVLNEALGLNPDSSKGHYLLGRAHRALGDIGQARAEFEHALRLDDFDPAVHYQLGMLLGRLGEREASRRHLQRFEELNKSAK
jgi:tetratricopeptide (TPR) repeat protein